MLIYGVMIRNRPQRVSLRKVGITEEQYDEYVQRFGMLCKICGGVGRDMALPNPYNYRCTLELDHDHKTGKFRGMLCRNCNTALGKFKDSPELLTKAIKYLDLKDVQWLNI